MSTYGLAVMFALAGCGRIAFDPYVDAGPPPQCASNPEYTVRGTQSNRYKEIVDQAWQQGFDACVADEAHLAVPDTAAEAGMLVSINGVWVGVDDQASEGRWVTALGRRASYLPWGMGQPSGGTAENCVELAPDTSFNDLACTDHRSAICECELP